MSDGDVPLQNCSCHDGMVEQHSFIIGCYYTQTYILLAISGLSTVQIGCPTVSEWQHCALSTNLLTHFQEWSTVTTADQITTMPMSARTRQNKMKKALGGDANTSRWL